ncbi:MAG: hydroxymethylglutaryl-CoA lyase [Chitinophagales bacterium]|nr:hydroxymethylglutaryl-CoA lyase [Chitinophagales bacterium]
MTQHAVKIIECPRDAMQGIREFIPTAKKIAYINKLLQVGFHSIDFGSFVNHDIIPQMADTAEVIEALDTENNTTKLIAIIANERGAMDACRYSKINCLGFPFSVSETFQRRNANSTIRESVDRVKQIRELCAQHNKELIIYISMGFGNPYGDPYSPQIVEQWVSELQNLNISTFMLSDTVGIADPGIIAYLFSTLIPAFPHLEFGAHLHTAPHNWRVKIDAAYNNGCRRFDAAIKGYGGCPMAKDDLIGNMPTENLLNYFSEEQLGSNFSIPGFEDCLRMAAQVFPVH